MSFLEPSLHPIDLITVIWSQAHPFSGSSLIHSALGHDHQQLPYHAKYLKCLLQETENKSPCSRIRSLTGRMAGCGSRVFRGNG